MIKSVKGIIVKDNKYLLQLKDNKKNIFFPNFWGLFGGRLDKDETFENALIRELKEETNLDVRVQKKIFKTQYEMIGLKKKRELNYCECKVVKNNDKIILSEGKKYNFFLFEQIKRLKIIPLDFVAISTHYYYINNYKSLYS